MHLSSYAAGLLANVGVNVLAALGFYIIWSTGQLSLGNAAFLAVGAYASAVLTVDAHLPLTASLILAFIATGAIGALIAFPALRLQGIYLAIATIGFGEIVRTFFLNFSPTGGAQGFHGIAGTTPLTIWIWTGLIFAGLVALERSRLWLEFRAVADDEPAAALTGLDTTAVKVAGFALGAGITAVAGGLMAHYLLYIEPGDFTFARSVEIVLAVVLGGSTTVFGPLLGASLLTLLPEALRSFADWRYVVYGVLLIAVLYFRREGLLSRAMFRWRKA